MRDVLPAELTRLLASRRLQADLGATEFAENGARDGYFPGFGLDPRDADSLPELDSLSGQATSYESLSRAACLRGVDDCAWWDSGMVHEKDVGSMISAMNAANHLLRMPAVRISSYDKVTNRGSYETEHYSNTATFSGLGYYP